MKSPRLNLSAWLTTGTAGFWVFLVLAFGGSMFWAKSWDRYERVWFKVPTANYGKFESVAVLSKPVQPRPVVIFMHGSGGSLLTSGNTLRQLSEMRLNAVGLEYSQTNFQAAEEQVLALAAYLSNQKWAKGEPVIWVGYSLGAQTMLRTALRHPEHQPDLMVRLAGGKPASSSEQSETEGTQKITLRCPVLMIHSDVDDVFPIADVKNLAACLRSNGVPVDLKLREGKPHALGLDSAIVTRAIGEYCQAHFTPGKPLEVLPEEPAGAKPFVFCIAPSFVWAGFWYMRRRNRAPAPTQEASGTKQAGKQTCPPLQWWEKLLRVVAILLATIAIALSAVHLWTPRFAVSERTLAVARTRLIPPKWREDFDELAAKPFWKGHSLKTLLTHVELAHYNCYELINWKVEKEIYTKYVLSPIIDSESDPELNWRRPLWEFYYPRVRKEDSPELAAQIVARELRARVSIDPRCDYPTGIETIWRSLVTTPKGFERIYVATLRSVGVGARLNDQGAAEFWSGAEWKPAPRPEIVSYLSK